MREHEPLIQYQILDDGTCSYCGRETNLIELPDGDITRSHLCQYCEEFNLDLKTITALEVEPEPQPPSISLNSWQGDQF